MRINLLISSEDVKCFFYTMRVPDCWVKYLASNKPVPQSCLPSELQGKLVYLASRVLPMGFLNSESLAQNVHRNLVQWSGERVVALGSAELRKDRPFTVANPSWRVYLDNYDLLATWRRSLPLVSWNWKEAWPRASWRCVSNHRLGPSFALMFLDKGIKFLDLLFQKSIRKLLGGLSFTTFTRRQQGHGDRTLKKYVWV